LLLTSHSLFKGRGETATIQTTPFPGTARPKQLEFPGAKIYLPSAGDLFFVSFPKGESLVYSCKTLTQVGTLPMLIQCAGVGRSGRVLATYDGTNIVVMSWPDKKLLCSFSRPRADFPGLSVDEATGSIFFSGDSGAASQLERLYYRGTNSGSKLRDFSATGAIVLSPNHRFAFVGDAHGSADLFSLGNWKHVFQGNSREGGSIYPTDAVDWSADGRFIAAGYWTGELKVWEVSAGL